MPTDVLPPLAASLGFVWVDSARRWRNVATGRFISQSAMVDMRNVFIDGVKGQSDALVKELFAGNLRSNQWAAQLRQLIRSTYIDEYAAANGGILNFGVKDSQIVSKMLTQQWQYLYQFQQDLNAGKLSLLQAQARARMYLESATQAFERGQSEAWDMDALPAYPGDGQTACHANCRCHWKIEETDKDFECTWVLGDAEHCDDCVNNATQWAPYIAAKIRM
jgi:hypothetical protein